MALVSCQNNDDSLLEEEKTGQGVELRLSFYENNFNKIYYFSTGSPISSDNYYTTKAPIGSTRTINGKLYTYKHQEFSIIKNNYYGSSGLELFCHYNPTTNTHRLSKLKSISGFINEGSLGYLLQESQPGTVELFEYYNSTQKSYVYTCRRSEKEKLFADNTYKFIQHLGFVYPDMHDSKKNSHSFTIKHNFGMPVEIMLTVTYKDNGVVKTVAYERYTSGNYYENKGSTTKKFQFPPTAILIDAKLSYRIIFADGSKSSSEYSFNHINTPNFSGTSFGSKLKLAKHDGYHTFYELDTTL